MSELWPHMENVINKYINEKSTYQTVGAFIMPKRQVIVWQTVQV